MSDSFEQVVLLHPLRVLTMLYHSTCTPCTLHHRCHQSLQAEFLLCFSVVPHHGCSTVFLFAVTGWQRCPAVSLPWTAWVAAVNLELVATNCTSFFFTCSSQTAGRMITVGFSSFFIYSIHSCFLREEAPKLFQSIC